MLYRPPLEGDLRMANILLIEDNRDIMKINASALNMRGYTVLCAGTLEEGRDLLLFHSVDLIVLDVMLPDGNGIAWCRKVKAVSDVPILFLSALGESADIIAGLRAGGDDYLSKPYDLEVLAARIETRLRGAAQPRYLHFGPLRLDTLSLTAFLKEEDLLLTQKEFSVLLLLIKNANHTIDKEQLYRSVWGQPLAGDGRALYTVISRLKKKLEQKESGISIALQRAEGYRLERAQEPKPFKQH